MESESQANIDTDKSIDTSKSNWSIVLVTVIVIACVLTAMLIPIPFVGRIPRALGDLVHAPFFGAATLFLLAALQRFAPLQLETRSFVRRIVIVATTMVLFGIAMEFAQGQMRRSPSVGDAVSNALGVAAASCCFVAWALIKAGRNKRLMRFCLFALSAALIMIAWKNPLSVLYDVYLVRADFPMLSSFESEHEIGRWYRRGAALEICQSNVTHGNSAAEIVSRNGQECGITMIEMESDWSQMKSLELDVVLVDQPEPKDNVSLLVRVVDSDHAKHNVAGPSKTFALVINQPQHVSMLIEELIDSPTSTRQLDPSDVVYLDIWMLGAAPGTKLHVDHVHLE